MGIVYLVGAGPGDPGLLTRKAEECIKKAEVLVYDRLADPRILALAPEGAELIYVGKASSHHTMKQEDICKLLREKALAGKVVVRLKGGDPYVFGRGGEEAIILDEAGVPFEVVPGITSAIAVAAYAGIPVTHRAVATSFAVVTGHEDPEKGGSNMRWEHLSTGVDTLVFLMGVENLPKITKKLVENGRDPATPAALIRWGTRPEQRTVVTTVGEAAADAVRLGVKPPAIFIVGEVVRLREKLQWFDREETHPLFGRTVLVTRARSQASRLTEGLETLGARVLEAPAIKIVPPADGYAALDAAIADIYKFNWLIFTSANGVEHFFSRLALAGKDARALGYAKLAAIGPATAAALKKHGLTADVVPAEYRAEGVIEALKGKVAPHARLLIPRAAEAREILPESLKKLGYEVTLAPAYETTVGDAPKGLREKLEAGEIDLVTFTSSSTVKNLVQILGDASPLEHTKCAAIGPITAKTAADLGVKIDIEAESYTIDGLIEAIRKNIQ